jgi:glycerol-1-phosphate dehydrogenase [NAD(P)+]
MPIGVFIDVELIINSPQKYIQAAAGDILSNMSATNDWLYAKKNSNDQIEDISFQMSRMSAHSLIYFKQLNFNSKSFIKMVVQSQLNSGIAMGLSGTSRPCSGSEHLLSHAIDYLCLSKNKLHGFQVGVLSLFCLYLQDKLSYDILLYAKNIQLPFSLDSICDTDKKILIRIFSESRKMRPGRITILDNYSDEILFKKYNNYIEFVNSFVN